jgi:hypothetical protein
MVLVGDLVSMNTPDTPRMLNYAPIRQFYRSDFGLASSLNIGRIFRSKSSFEMLGRPIHCLIYSSELNPKLTCGQCGGRVADNFHFE